MNSLLSRASVTDLTRGFVEDEVSYHCLACGTRVEKGVIYPVDSALFEALRFLRHHLESRHGSPFDVLIALDKDATGLSDIQRRILDKSYRGFSDDQLRDELGVGSTSTIRNHRASLREKERQARVFLALMDLLAERSGTAGPGDKALSKYIPDGVHISRMPTRDKDRRRVVAALAERFEKGQIYTEKQVNAILQAAWHDYSSLRRYLVAYGFLDRKDDGSQYWRRPVSSTQVKESTVVDRKTELKREARALKPVAGVYQIKNHRNGKVLVEATRNLKSMNGRQFGLETGHHPNRNLQLEWNEYGKAAFTFDILETVADDAVDVADALRILQRKWIAQLQPAYNT